MRIEDALRVAADADLDLVEVAPNARPPVCKIMDYGKFKYEAAQRRANPAGTSSRPSSRNKSCDPRSTITTTRPKRVTSSASWKRDRR